MKKLLTLFTALILFGSMMVVLATDYYVAGIGSWDPNARKMEQVGTSAIYTTTFTDLAQSQQQFKVTENGTWDVSFGWNDAKQNLSNISLSESGGNVAFTPLSASIKIYFNSESHKIYVIDESVAYVTLSAGTTVYYNLTSYTGSGINIYAPGAPTDWYASTASLISFNLSEDWVISSDITLFRSGPNDNWDNRKCATLPTTGQNMIVSADGINCSWDTYVGPVIRPTIKMHGDFLSNEWANTEAFTLADNKETASLTMAIPTKGTKHFGMRIGSDDNWTSNGESISRTKTSAVIESGSGNCALAADIPGEYTFTWTFASNTLSVIYPDLPEQYVEFDGLSDEILKGTNITFAATSTGITNPVYTYYVKPAGGEYGSAVTSYAFNVEGSFVVKVSAEGDNTAAPIVEEETVSVYSAYTFTTGTRIYVDFTAMTEGAKAVNYPFGHLPTGLDPLDYDEDGAGKFKVVQFSQDVTWTTLKDFIKTAKAGWDNGMKFIVPGTGQNKIIVAADGASYTWGTHTQAYYLKNKWDDGDWTWKVTTAAGDGTYRLENVIFGGNGVNYNLIDGDEGATWKEYTKIKYKEGATEKVVAVFDTINLVLDPANDTIWAEMIKKESVVYTVAGSSLALFDLGWEPTHPYKYTDMTKQADGTYKWNNGGNEATLPAGWIELKVVKNRSFANGCWPKIENFKYEIKRSGEYEIAIHFNPYTEAIWIDTVLTEPLNIQALSIKGSWDGWAAATPLKLGGENDKSLVTLSLAAGTYNFKLVDGQNSWYGGGEAYTRNSFTHDGITAKEEAAAVNMTVNIDKAGEYLFTYFFDTEQLMISYPAIVPEEVIAPLSGRFTINAQGDLVRFARGNLMYNYETDKWYTAEKQYEVLGDLNLRFGDNFYTGSIDLFGWSTENSDYGKQWKYKDEEFNGDFKDWGELFAGGDEEWSTLSEAEWNFIMARTKGGKNLWTMIALTSDSLNGLALFPDDWVAPACASEMIYGFYNLDDTPNYRKNTFMLDEWAEMEAAGAVFIPLAGARAGFWDNTWTGSAETTLSNPLSSGYDWVDNVNWMGYYWLSTNKTAKQASTAILPGWHNYQWNAPTIWSREKRRGQPVRLVTRIPALETIRDGLSDGKWGTLCPKQKVIKATGASFYQISYLEEKDGLPFNMVFDEISGNTLTAGQPYFFIATGEKILGNKVGAELDAADPAGVNGFYGHIGTSPKALSYLAEYTPGSDNTFVIYNNMVYRINGPTDLKSERCYININSTEPTRAVVSSNPSRRRITMRITNTDSTTGIDDLKESETPRKALLNGQLFIIRGDKVYDATGRLVK